jgi:hypothetical protein
MAREYVSVDVSNVPELKRLAEAVRRTGKPHALKEGAETIAVVRPAPRRVRSTRSPQPPSTDRGSSSEADSAEDAALAKKLEDDLRANRETPVDRAALFAPPSREVLAQRRAVYEQIQSRRHERSIAPLTAADLIQLARAEEEEAYGAGH